jgi:epoxyqueuosine reductase
VAQHTADRLKQLAREHGAVAVGISGVERLAGPPSMDAEYLLPGARSIISVMVAFDPEIIHRYLSKEDRRAMQRHETALYRRLDRVGQVLGQSLCDLGHRAVVCETNLDYRFKTDTDYGKVPYRLRQWAADWMRKESPPWLQRLKRAALPRIYERGFGAVDWNLTPSFSHRYGAVAAGIGALGWSGNVLHPDHGAQVLYNTVITDLELPEDPMLEETPCDGCRLCTRVCQSNFMSTKEAVEVTIGGRMFSHNRKAHNLRCILVCAGFSGQNKHPGWSTWSPGRLTLPSADADLPDYWRKFVFENLWRPNYYAKVLSDLVFHTHYGHVRKPQDRFDITCGNCQFICAPTRKQRQKNVKLLRSSGEVPSVHPTTGVAP